MEKYGFKPIKITIDSNVPKNLGSSSSVFSAIALALSRFLGKDLSKKEISELAYQGDVIAHGGTPSGIDNNIVTYGGYIRYKKSEGVNFLDLGCDLNLIFVDSGEPARTGETVSYIRNQRKENKGFVDSILENLENISRRALDALKNENLELVGKLMTNYYTELRKLKISTKRLDKIVNIAIRSKALGVKPTGGWGGGCCIVLAKDRKQMSDLMKIYEKNRFNSFSAKIGVEGVKII
jgi:mevalonate kinase